MPANGPGHGPTSSPREEPCPFTQPQPQLYHPGVQQESGMGTRGLEARGRPAPGQMSVEREGNEHSWVGAGEVMCRDKKHEEVCCRKREQACREEMETPAQKEAERVRIQGLDDFRAPSFSPHEAQESCKYAHGCVPSHGPHEWVPGHQRPLTKTNYISVLKQSSLAFTFLQVLTNWRASLVAGTARICLQCRRPRFDPWVDKISRRELQSLQYSCLGNLMDRGSWGTTVHGVKKSPILSL